MRNLNAKGRKDFQKGGRISMGEVIAYARVSTDGQSFHDQIVQLKAAGATRVLSEKLSGARSDRRQLRKAIAALGEGDVLIVTRLDIPDQSGLAVARWMFWASC
jgi:predicted site-specific integrase-resolvase